MFFQIVVVVLLALILNKVISVMDLISQLAKNQSMLVDIYADFFKSLKIDRVEKK